MQTSRGKFAMPFNREMQKSNTMSIDHLFYDNDKGYIFEVLSITTVVFFIGLLGINLHIRSKLRTTLKRNRPEKTLYKRHHKCHPECICIYFINPNFRSILTIFFPCISVANKAQRQPSYCTFAAIFSNRRKRRSFR